MCAVWVINRLWMADESINNVCLFVNCCLLCLPWSSSELPRHCPCVIVLNAVLFREHFSNIKVLLVLLWNQILKFVFCSMFFYEELFRHACILIEKKHVKKKCFWQLYDLKCVCVCVCVCWRWLFVFPKVCVKKLLWVLWFIFLLLILNKPFK